MLPDYEVGKPGGGLASESTERLPQTFAAVNLPPLGSGSWNPRYDDPPGTFTLWVLES